MISVIQFYESTRCSGSRIAPSYVIHNMLLPSHSVDSLSTLAHSSLWRPHANLMQTYIKRIYILSIFIKTHTPTKS